MRFVLGLWLLILGSLLIFTLVLFFHELFAQDLPEVVQKAILLVAAWVTGLVSAAAIHLLHRRAEKVSQRAARDQTVVQLAGAVAHELNQPLTVLISSGELICHPGRTPDDMREVATRMVDASQRISDIVEKLHRATHYITKDYVAGIKIVELDRAS